MGLDPAGVGLASANTWDVTGAKTFGMWAAWVNRTDAPWEDLGFAPDATVANLTELPQVLGLSSTP